MTSYWTPDAIKNLGTTTDIPTAGDIFGLSRWRSYQMARTGEWEQAGIRVLRIGCRYRVTVSSILAVLTGPAPPAAGHDPPPCQPRTLPAANITQKAQQTEGNP